MVGEEYPEECQPPDAQIPDSMMTMPEAVDVQDSPISDQEVVEMGQEALEAPDQDVYGGGGFARYWSHLRNTAPRTCSTGRHLPYAWALDLRKD